MVGIYVRTIKRKSKDGSEVEYIQLAHNSRHPEKGYSRAEVIYSFGRRDQLDMAAIKRLVGSLCRFVTTEDALELEAEAHDLKFISRRPAGGSFLLRGLWEQLNIDECITKLLRDSSLRIPVSSAIFAMVANRGTGLE